MDNKYPKMSPEKYAEMIIEAKKKKRKDESQGCTIPEPVEKWLESNGIDVDTLLRLEPLLRKYNSLTDEQKARFLELKDFEPNPGKAELNEVRKTDLPVLGKKGAPIYQEDIDMLRKSQPVAKKILEIQKRKERLDDTSLLTGPDTTENIQEIRDSGDVGDKPQVDSIPKESRLLKTLSMRKGDEVWKDNDWKNRSIFNEKKDGLQGDWQPGVKFPAGAVEKGLVDPGLEYYEATGRRPETPIEKYYVREHMKSLKPEEREHYEKLFAGTENEETPDVMWYFDPESQNVTNQEKAEIKRPKVVIDSQMYPTTEEMKKYIGEQCNKNVSQDEDKKDPGDYYKYSTILKRMDDTHTRKNNDYGDAAYQGYKKFGDYYFMVQLHNKYQRLESLTIGNKTQQVKEESIDDTLLDMANYAVMYLESRHRND